MQIFASLLQYITLFVLLMIPGFMMGRKGRITDGGSNTLTNLLTDIAMPLLVFNKLLRFDFNSLRLSSVVCCLLLPLVSILAVLCISLEVFPKTGDKKRFPAERFCSMMPNCGFMGIPLAAAVFPHAPEVVLYVSVVNILCTYTLLTLGTYVMSGDKGEIKLKKLLLHPVLFAVVLGFLCTRLPAPALDFVENYSTQLANLATPVSMLVLGFRLSKLKVAEALGAVSFYKVLGMKLIVMPLVTIAVLFLIRVAFGPMDQSLMMAMLLATGVSTAGSAPALAQRYGLDAEHTAALTIGTTVVSVLTVPVMSLLLEAIV